MIGSEALFGRLHDRRGAAVQPGIDEGPGAGGARHSVKDHVDEDLTLVREVWKHFVKSFVVLVIGARRRVERNLLVHRLWEWE